MKTINKIISVFIPFLFIFAIVIAGCGDKDYGKLTVYKIENLIVGQSQKISYVFSDEKYASEITYSFNGGDIEIENSTVTALVGGKKVMVTAKTQYHETVFGVSTVDAPDGESEIVTNTVNCWLGYPAAPLDIYFADEYEKNSAVYEYDTSAIFIDETDLTVTPIKSGEYTVKVSTFNNDGVSFKVNCREMAVNVADKLQNNDYVSRLGRVGRHSEAIKTNCTENTTLFIGDSFFDPEEFFWPYIQEGIYPNKDVLVCGVGTATTYYWENYLAEKIITFNKKPANVVINLGTNNLYNGIGESDGAVSAESLERLFLVLRNALPDAQFYYFSVAPRGYNTDKVQTEVQKFNTIIKDFCNKRREITFIDVFETMKTKIRDDNIHPVQSAYKEVYAAELAKAGCVVADKK